MLLDGPTYRGQLPCLLCRHARSRKNRDEWSALCGGCRSLSGYEIDELIDAQDVDPDRVVIPPDLFRASRMNSDARYEAALASIRAHGVPAGSRILDVGCGVSAQAGLFEDYLYVGADLNDSRVRFGASQHPRAAYAIQNIVEMGFATAAFQAVICLEVIEHLPDEAREALMRELLRVLSAGGVLVLSTPDGERTWGKRVFGHKCERSHEIEMTADEVKDLVTSCGGRVTSVAVVDNLIQPASRLGALMARLAGDRIRLRRALQTFWTRLGYRTVIYAIAAEQGDLEQDINSGTVTSANARSL